MAAPAFVHLRLHTEFSITDGMTRISEVLDQAVEDEQVALAITDLANVFGAVKFYQAARRRGVKPIIGCDVWLSHAEARDEPHRLLLLCQDRRGWLRLCELLSQAYCEHQYRGRAEIDPSWFDRGDNRGLLALSGAQLGDVGHLLAQSQEEAAQARARLWAMRFPGAYYLEVQRTGSSSVEKVVQATFNLAQQLDLPVVATQAIQFSQPEDFKAHEARVCIATGYTLGDQKRPQLFTSQQAFTRQTHMQALFADAPAALANTVEVAKRCNFMMELGKSKLPEFPTPPGVSLADYLQQEAQTGLQQRLQALFPILAQRERETPRYLQRLAFETETIIQMGFPGYFLIVADFINWAKTYRSLAFPYGIPVGPGRGSGAGSLVAFALGITDLDPLRYDLLFERFLNPERVSMPDFDIDFCQDGRDLVIHYVKEKYGVAAVSQIATFGTMAAKAVIRDVGRVLGMSYGHVDGIAKLIPNELGISLAKARQMEPQIDERARAEEEVAQLLVLAERLEGITRNVGMHAGGVLIAPGKLTDFCPLYVQEGSDSVVSQFDKDDVEAVGLVKFDFLGLRTLTIIDWAIRFIQQLDPHKQLDISQLPLDDVATYDLLKAAKTTAVFQLESHGMKNLIAKLRPDRFDDIIALVALFRPGPLGSGMVDDFINRKHGRAAIDYFHPKLETCLDPTYGVIVYQEQVMQIAQVLGGYTLGAADMLRRAMGKKKPEEMAKHRSIFVGGAIERGVEAAQAEYLFDLMEKFAEYGFNKSHSAAYALVAYQTAYLKAHYPAAFMAATLSADMDDTEKVHTFISECREMGLVILPPDINQSNFRFTPTDLRTIRYGLGAVKGTGEAALSVVLSVRESAGPFRDIFDFCQRVDKRTVNKRTIEALVRAGAFDHCHPERAHVLATVELAMGAAEQVQQHANQASLFDLLATPAQDSGLVLQTQLPAWTESERLQQEKMALGLYLSGHPFDPYRVELRQIAKTSLERLQAGKELQWVAGVVMSVRSKMTARGRMMFVHIDDGSAQREVAVYHELSERCRAMLREDQLLVLAVKVSPDDYSGGLRLVAEEIFDLAQARVRLVQRVRLRLPVGASTAALAAALEAVPAEEKSPQIFITLQHALAQVDVKLGMGWRMKGDEVSLQALRLAYGADSVQWQF